MVWFIAVCAVAVLGVAAFVASGHFGSMAPLVTDDPVPAIPADRPLTVEDLDAVQFSLAWRGYKPDQVDALLARVRHEVGLKSATSHVESTEVKE